MTHLRRSSLVLLGCALSIPMLTVLAPASAANDDLTYEQALAQLEAQFKAADKNGDGRLTKQEAKDADMKRLSRGFGRVDKEDRGYVTLDQLKKRLADRYD